jgi:segregation and condensation protein A
VTPPATDQYQVQIDVFEGPLDLLLKLIERKQLDISKVSLAEVAEGFLLYLEANPSIPPGPLAQFVWVASKLVWIKSQMLLPRPPHEKADDEEDPGDELVRRLEAYRRVQAAARWLREREAEGLKSFERPVSLLDVPVGDEVPLPQGSGLDGVTLAKLVKLVQRRMQTPLPTHTQVDAPMRGHRITVAEKVAGLRKRLGRLGEGKRVPLGAEFAEAAGRSRTEVVVLFLAVLEVVRRKWGRVDQEELFGEIWLSRYVDEDEKHGGKESTEGIEAQG